MVQFTPFSLRRRREEIRFSVVAKLAVGIICNVMLSTAVSGSFCSKASDCLLRYCRLEYCSSHVSLFNCNVHSRMKDMDCNFRHVAPPQMSRYPVLCLPCQPDKPIRAVKAPMVAASDYAFRCLIRQYGILNDGSGLTVNEFSSRSKNPNNHDGMLTFTQMLHAKNLLEDETFFTNHFDIYEYSTNGRVHAEDLTKSQKNVYRTTADYTSSQAPFADAAFGPVIAQLAGNDATIVVAAAKKIIHRAQEQIAGIDINLGCPQTIAKKGNYGAFLMEESPEKVYALLKALRQAIPESISVSAKIRLPLDPKRQTSVIQQLCDTGINFLTIHGRDFTENKTTVKQIQLPRLVEAVQTAREYSGLPVIVNGGVEYLEDAIRLQAITGAAAVMSSEAILERPTLLAQINACLGLERPQESMSSIVSNMTAKDRFWEQIQFARDYVKWCYYAPPLRGVLGTQGGSFNVVRSHLFKMLYRYLNDEANIDLRDSLANGYTMHRLDQASDLIDSLCIRYQHFTDEEWEILSSSRYPDSSWYRRHRRASLAGIFIHQRTKEAHPPSTSDERFLASDKGILSTTVAIDERKRSIRLKIEKLRKQKRATNFL